MAADPLTPVLRHARGLAGPPPHDAIPDAELLARFALACDPAAFEALVRRHGALVWRVCRRVLGEAQDAEDAWQGTFLCLARQARSIRKGAALASWLHGVAFRIADKARRAAGRRKARERAAACRAALDPAHEAAWRELGRLVEKELHRLPEKYRLPLLLTYWRGLTNEQAALDLGWRPGTFKARLARARELLHSRLTARGVTLPAGAMVLLLAPGPGAGAAVPAGLIGALTRASAALAAGQPGATGGLPARADELARGVWPAAGLGKVKLGIVLALALGVAGLGAGVLSQPQELPPPEEAKQADVGKQPATDLHGDPLPPGAVARLGTVRLRHASSVQSIAFAPAGNLLASAGDDAVRLWDIATGREVRRLPQRADRVAFSPDGRLLATGGHDGPVRLWDAATARPLRRLEWGEDTYALAFSPDGKAIASGGRAGSLFLDDVATGKRLRQWRVPGRLASVAFSPDGRRLATATTGGLVQVWELATQAEAPQFRGQKLPGIHVAFSPDGRLLAAAPVSGGFGLWEVATGKAVHREAGGYGEVVFSPSGRTLAAPDLGAVRLWEAATGKPVAALPWRHPPPAHVRFSPDGKYLAASGGGGPAITIWELSTGKEVSPLPAHRDPIRAVAFAPDGRTLAAVEADGRTLAAVEAGGEGTGALTLWRLATRQGLRRLPGPAGHGPAVLFVAGGREVLAGPGVDGAVGRWEVGTGKQLPFVPRLAQAHARALAVSPDGQALAVSASDRSVNLYDAGSGQQRGALRLTAGEGYVLALSPGGRLLAYADGAGSAVLADTASGKTLHRFRHEALLALAFSRDGRLLATGGSGPVRLWQVATGQELPSLPGHGDPGQTTAVAFSPDGRGLASSGYDGTVRVWELATRGQRLLFRPQQRVFCLAYSGDGSLLASGNFDTTVLLWDLTGRSARQRTDGPRGGDAGEPGDAGPRR
jgi:RNA polymerase sigma factor (sigma-70 family)